MESLKRRNMTHLWRDFNLNDSFPESIPNSIACCLYVYFCRNVTVIWFSLPFWSRQSSLLLNIREQRIFPFHSHTHISIMTDNNTLKYVFLISIYVGVKCQLKPRLHTLQIILNQVVKPCPSPFQRKDCIFEQYNFLFSCSLVSSCHFSHLVKAFTYL